MAFGRQRMNRSGVLSPSTDEKGKRVRGTDLCLFH